MVTTLLYGLYTAAVAIVLLLAQYFTGLDKTSAANWFGYLNLPFLAFFIYLAAKERKEEEFSGRLTYGQGVGTGALIGLWAGILTAIFMWLYLSYINPGFVDMIVERQRTALLQSGKTSAADINRISDATRKFAAPISIAVVLLSNVFFATIFSLIISIFVQTKEDSEGVKSV